jgi:CheY-like chemotaxis protein
MAAFDHASRPPSLPSSRVTIPGVLAAGNPPPPSRQAPGLIAWSTDASVLQLASRTHPIHALLAGARPAQQRVTCAILADLQVNALVAQDGVEAAHLAREHAFDIVLIDVDTSVLDSLFVTARIRLFERETPSRRPAPVVAYTGMEPTPFEALLKHTGANDVLRKSEAAVGMSACLNRWCPGKFDAARL